MRSLVSGPGRRVRQARAVFLLAALVACATAPREPRAPAPIRVENLSFQPITLYLRVEQGALVRLGEVEAASTTTLYAPVERLRRGAVRLVIQARSGETVALEERLELFPGELLRVRVVEPWIYSAVYRQR